MQPNILFLFTDQQRFDTIEALGAPTIKTPALNRLVCEGVSYTRAYTPSPVCVSARFALLTGLPPHDTGCVDNRALDVSYTTFIEGLRDTGYVTHGVGKMHFYPNPREMRGFQSRDHSEPFGDDDYKQFLADRGFDHVDEPFGVRSEYYYIPQVSQLPASAHHTHWVADKSVDFLRRRPKDRPFFLWAGFFKPHPPFESPTPWNKLYRAAEMPAPHRPPGFHDQLSFWNHVQNRYKYRDAGTDDLLIRTMRAAYYSSISFIDHNIGRILNALGDEIDQTLVVFASDHGEMLGDFGAFGKRCMLEASARVPLVIRWPEINNAGTRIASPASLLDLHPTFLRAAGVRNPDHHPEAVDLAEMTDNGSRRYVYSQFSSAEWGTYMVSDGRWKYSYCAADEKEWLHDLASSAGEDRNLLEGGAHHDEADRLRSALIDRFARDGYTSAVQGDSWREYGTSQITEDGDFGLLFQDPKGLQTKVDGLGSYARPILPEGMGHSILSGVRKTKR